MDVIERSLRGPRDRRGSGIARLAAAVIAGWLLCPTAGHTQPVASSTDPPPRPTRDEQVLVPAPAAAREPTAADLAGAPVPGAESGRLDRIDGGDSPPRLIARGFLYLPKLAVQVAMAPVRAGIWANDRYRIVDHTWGVLFNEPGTIGIYPTARLESGFGVTVGARLIHRSLFGAREKLSLKAAAGGRFRQAFEASLRSGERFGERLKLELTGEYERRPNERFYGIGNRDEVAALPDPAMPMDALDDAISLEVRHRQQLARASAVGGVHVAGPLHVLGAGALTDFRVGRGEDGPPIDQIYRPETLIGWGGARHIYTELELRWDTRRAASPWEPTPVVSSGGLASVYGGQVHRIDGGGPDFWRYGAELQRFVHLARGPRVLAARAHVEGVTGARGEVPFFELPALGGTKLLRGYPTERFRDRIAAVGSLDYQWDLSQLFSARVFADVGRVYASTHELALSGMRLGYGVGLDVHTQTRFWLRGSIASSIDGGVFLDLSFEPVFAVDHRVERR
jgi:hypothetical protein